MKEAPHLHFKLTDCNENLWNTELMREFLLQAPIVLDMEPITPPFVKVHLTPDDEEGGVSSFIMIATSHISLHSFPNKMNSIWGDLFSCQKFSLEGAEKFVTEFFKPSESEWQYLDRQTNKLITWQTYAII